MTTLREEVENVVRCFVGLASQKHNDVWRCDQARHDLDTATTLLRLIDSSSVTQSDVSSIIGIVHANMCRSSIWVYLAYMAYHWASTNGFQVPPPNDFFNNSDSDLCVAAYESPNSLGVADMFVAHFRQKVQDDPHQETWELALTCALTWRGLMICNTLPESETTNLIQNLKANHNRTEDWNSLFFAVHQWFNEKKMTALWSAEFQW